MVENPVRIFWTVLGVLCWPEFTLCVILWKLNYPLLALFALFFGSTTSIKEKIRERIVDSRTGAVVSEREI